MSLYINDCSRWECWSTYRLAEVFKGEAARGRSRQRYAHPSRVDRQLSRPRFTLAHCRFPSFIERTIGQVVPACRNARFAQCTPISSAIELVYLATSLEGVQKSCHTVFLYAVVVQIIGDPVLLSAV